MIPSEFVIGAKRPHFLCLGVGIARPCVRAAPEQTGY